MKNMGPNFGGIGATEPVIDPAEDVPRRTVPRVVEDDGPQALILEHQEPLRPRTPGAAVDLERARADIASINDTVGRILSDTSTFGERLHALEQIVNQQRGQVAQLEAHNQQIVQAFQTMDQRIRNHDQAMADIMRRLSANLRLAALDAAVKCKGPGNTFDQVAKSAETFLAFLDPPVPPGPPPAPEDPDESPAPSNWRN